MSLDIGNINKNFILQKIIRIFLLSLFISSISFANNKMYPPIKVYIPKEDHTGDAYFLAATYLLRHNPAVIGGLITIGGLGYFMDTDEIKGEEVLLFTGLTGFNYYAQTLKNRDIISMLLNGGLVLLNLMIPKQEPDKLELIVNSHMFVQDQLCIDYQTSNDIFFDLRDKGYLKKTYGFYGKITKNIDTTDKVEQLKIDEKFIKYKPYVIWVLKQIVIYKNQGSNENIVFIN